MTEKDKKNQKEESAKLIDDIKNSAEDSFGIIDEKNDKNSKGLIVKEKYDIEKSENKSELVVSETDKKATGGLLAKIKKTWAKRPRFNDQNQKSAFNNIIRFLAIILVLTLFARGMSGATIPRVTTGNPKSGIIEQRISANGTVENAGSTTVEVPAKLTVKEIAAEAGDSVKVGDKIARLDLDEVTEQRIREKARLDELTLELNKLKRADNKADDSAVKSAEQALANARNAYNAQVDVNNANIALKQAEYDAAKNAYDALVADPAATPEAVTAAYDLMDTAKKALDNAVASAAQDLLPLSDAIKSAEASLKAAQEDYAKAKQDAADGATSNSIAIKTKELDVAAQKEIVDTINKIYDNAGWVISDEIGTIIEVQAVGTLTDGVTPLAKVSSKDGGFTVNATVSKKDGAKLKPGTAVSVSTSNGSFVGNYAEAKISRVSQPDQSGNVTITIKLSKGDWEHGQGVKIEVVLDSQEYYLCVPLSAVFSESGGYYVLIVVESTGIMGVENVVQKVTVSLLAKDNFTAAIEGSLSQYESIVTSSTKPLAAGDKVRIEENDE